MCNSRGRPPRGTFFAPLPAWSKPGLRAVCQAARQPLSRQRRGYMRLLGTLLVIFGAILLIVGGLTFFVPAGVLDMGALSIQVNENLVIPMPPIAGLICLVVGLVMIMSAPVPYPPPPY